MLPDVYFSTYNSNALFRWLSRLVPVTTFSQSEIRGSDSGMFVETCGCFNIFSIFSIIFSTLSIFSSISVKSMHQPKIIYAWQDWKKQVDQHWKEQNTYLSYHCHESYFLHGQMNVETFLVEIKRIWFKSKWKRYF